MSPHPPARPTTHHPTHHEHPEKSPSRGHPAVLHATARLLCRRRRRSRVRRTTVAPCTSGLVVSTPDAHVATTCTPSTPRGITRPASITTGNTPPPCERSYGPPASIPGGRSRDYSCRTRRHRIENDGARPPMWKLQPGSDGASFGGARVRRSRVRPVRGRPNLVQRVFDGRVSVSVQRQHAGRTIFTSTVSP